MPIPVFPDSGDAGHEFDPFYSNTHVYPWLVPALQQLQFVQHDDQSMQLYGFDAQDLACQMQVRWFYSGVVILSQDHLMHPGSFDTAYKGRLHNLSHLLDLFDTIGWQFDASLLDATRAAFASEEATILSELRERLRSKAPGGILISERLPEPGLVVVVQHSEQPNPYQTNCMVASLVAKHPRADGPGFRDNYNNVWLASRFLRWWPLADVAPLKLHD